MSTNHHSDAIRLDTTYRQILRISLPISFSLFVPQFNFLANSWFLSMLGKGFLGAAGITGVYYLIFAVIGHGLNNGLQALISRRAGQGDLKAIGRLFSQSLYLAIIGSIFGILFTWFVAPVMFRHLVEPGLAEQAISFLRIRIFGLPFLYLYQMRNGLLVGTNQSRFLIWGTLAETVSNILLDYGLIFGHFGLPEMGFNGAAYASIIAEFIGMATVFGIIWLRDMHTRFDLFSDFRYDREQTRLLLDQSAPLILQYGVSIFTWEMFFIMISHHGRLALDISQFMRLMFGFCGIFSWAFGSTANTMVSNIIGQGKTDQVMPLVRRISRVSMILMAVFFVIIELIPGTLLSVMSQEPEFITQGIPVLRIIGVALMLGSFSVVWLNAVTGTGNSRATLVIEVITLSIYMVYIWLVLEKWDLSIAWGWGSEVLYWTSMFSMAYIYLTRFNWRKKRI